MANWFKSFWQKEPTEEDRLRRRSWAARSEEFKAAKARRARKRRR